MVLKKYIVKTRMLILDLNVKFPLIGKLFINGWSFLHLLKFKLGKKTLSLKGELKNSFDKIISNKSCWIDPQNISYYLTNKSSKLQRHNRILKGNWDLSIEPIEDLPITKAFRQKFKKGKKWEDSIFYQQVLNQISHGQKKWGCINKEEFDKRLKEIELIYDQISNSKENLSVSKGFFEKLEMPAFFKDINVNIGRDGQFLLISGKIRLLIAKLLDIPVIQVYINRRHKKWVDFKKDLMYLSRQGWLYQCLEHPDLQEFTFKYGDFRFNLIKEKTSISHGTLLDIGANLGYHCHKFEDEGFDCYAVEEDIYNVYFLKKLKKVANKKFKIIPISIFNYNKGRVLNFDIILALNVFHHFLTRKVPFLNLIRLLKRLKVKEFYFGAHNPKENLNAKAYRKFTSEQFVNFIIENSCLNKSEFIGKTRDGRKLYKLTP